MNLLRPTLHPLAEAKPCAQPDPSDRQPILSDSSVVGSEVLYDEAHTSMIRSSLECSIVGLEVLYSEPLGLSKKNEPLGLSKKNEPLGLSKKKKKTIFI
jgi:hypothetical protein